MNSTESPTSTFNLLEQARTGDREALSRAFEKHQRRLAVLIYYRLPAGGRAFDEVEDLVQETFLRACRDLDSFTWQSHDSFFRWLASIAGHVVIDRARYRGRERRAGEEVPLRSESNPAGPNPPTRSRPAACWPARRRWSGCWSGWTQLPEDYRHALVLAKIEGCTHSGNRSAHGEDARDRRAAGVSRAAAAARVGAGESR